MQKTTDLKSKHEPYGVYEKYLKRPLDAACGIAAVTVFGWFYIGVAVAVRINLGKPVIFKQVRPGKDSKAFTLYKFRTMTDKRDSEGKLLPDSERLTPFGRFLRSTSLDELPEAFNIIKGDMSIIGPRPLLPQYLEWYTEEEAHRHDVRPGLSGLAQVNGRNTVGWDERLKMDIDYVKKITFSRDIGILFTTVYKTLKRSDILMGEESTEGRLDEVRKEGKR